MSTQTVVSKESLLAELTAEHRRLDQEVQVLERRRSLTTAERADLTRLKKQKLLTKDRIARLS
ncbi:MAG: YdcH family protein [Myxococcales bacterium]|nr:YdcH family protein [Myxococcales bacterium]